MPAWFQEKPELLLAKMERAGSNPGLTKAKSRKKSTRNLDKEIPGTEDEELDPSLILADWVQLNLKEMSHICPNASSLWLRCLRSSYSFSPKDGNLVIGLRVLPYGTVVELPIFIEKLFKETAEKQTRTNLKCVSVMARESDSPMGELVFTKV